MDNKPWYLSKTVWGSIVMLLAMALKMTGVIDLSAEDLSQATTYIVDAATAISVLVGFILVIWGRIKAKTKLTK